MVDGNSAPEPEAAKRGKPGGASVYPTTNIHVEINTYKARSKWTDKY